MRFVGIRVRMLRVVSARRVREGAQRPGRSAANDGDAKRHQQTEPTTPRQHAATPAKRGRSRRRRRRAESDSMRSAPTSSAARNTRHKVSSGSSPRRPHRGLRTANSAHEVWAANGLQTRSGQRARQRELLEARGNAPGLLWLVVWGSARPGLRRSAGRPSV